MYTRILTFFRLTMAFGSVVVTAPAWAGTPTPEQCKATYVACEAKCQAEDPAHGFSYAGCSGQCVSSKAACESEILYDGAAKWSKKQYEAAKPWVQEKTQKAKELVNEAPNNVEYSYPPQN